MREYLSKRLAGSFSKGQGRTPPTLALICVVLLAAWMGNANGGYFVGDWTPVALILAALVLVVSIIGFFGNAKLRWEVLALGLFAAYTAWTFASLFWAPNKGDAWLGAGQTLLYLLVFWAAVALVVLGASRRWVLAASVVGPALIAAFTLRGIGSWIETMFAMFDGDRLRGTVGYFNGEAAFLLIPFWVSIYLGGSRSVNPVLRAAVLAGSVLSIDLAVLTQSRGAMVAMAVSLPVFFLFSGQRLRGLLALLPIAGALYVSFPGLNEVYLTLLQDENPAAALERVLPIVWVTAALAGLYGFAWGLFDRRWRMPAGVGRVAGAVALVGVAVVLVMGATTLVGRVGDPASFAQSKWEAFKTDDRAGSEQSRYLSASGTGRYTLWEVEWKNFTERPITGVGTQNYEATYYQLRDQDIGSVRQSHTLPLEVLGERGIVGGVLFFGFLATCIGTGLWSRFKKLSAEGKGQVGALIAAVTYWFVHSSAEWFWQLPAVTLPAFVYLALLVSPWRRGEFTPALPHKALKMVGIGVAVLALVVFTPLYAAERELERSYAAEDSAAALAAVERAQKFNPLAAHLPLREAELATDAGQWERAENAYKGAISLNPEHYAPYMFLATFYERRGELDKALSYYEKAQARNPLDKGIERQVTQLRALEVSGDQTSQEPSSR